MANSNTSFTALTSGTRDLTSEPGAIYYLDGDATSGRLNVSAGARVQFGDNTHVFVDASGSSSAHSYMRGVIEATGLTYILKPNGGRLDFGAADCGYDTRDVTFVMLGNGTLFHHLEDDNNLSDFKGFTRLVFNRSGGRIYVQFADKEYPNIGLQYKSSHSGTTNLYVSRSHAGFCHLTGFSTTGITTELGILYGSNDTSSGHIIDPTYEGVADNLLPLRITGNNGANKRMYESFSLDVTAIRHDEAKIRVTDGAGTVLHNDVALTSANTTPKANDGVTDLSYFDGKNVVLCRVRSITTTQSTSRNTISYLIRRLGYVDIEVSNLAMNAPVTISEMAVDPLYSNSNASLSEITTAQEFYDYAKRYEADDLTRSLAGLTRNGDTIDLGAYDLTIDATASSAFAVSGNAITIKADTFTGNLLTTGTITFQNGATINGSYQDAGGVLVSVSVPANSWSKAVDATGGTVRLAATQSATAQMLQFQMPANSSFILTVKQKDKQPYRQTHNSGSGLSLSPTILDYANYNTSFNLTSPTDYTGYWTPGYDSNTGKLTITINQPISSKVDPALATKNLLDYVLNTQAGIDFLAAQGLGLYSFTSQSIKVDKTKFDFVRNSSLGNNAASTSLNIISLDNTAFTPSDSNVDVPGTAQVFEVPQPTLEGASETLAAKVEEKLGADIRLARDHARGSNINTKG